MNEFLASYREIWVSMDMQEHRLLVRMYVVYSLKYKERLIQEITSKFQHES